METGIISIQMEQWLQVAKLSMVKSITLLHLVSGFNLGGDTNEAFEKNVQVALATFFLWFASYKYSILRIPRVDSLLIRIIENTI